MRTAARELYELENIQRKGAKIAKVKIKIFSCFSFASFAPSR